MAPFLVEAEVAELVLLTYSDPFIGELPRPRQRRTVQFAAVTKKGVVLLDGKALGIIDTKQRSGPSSVAMRNSVFKALGREIPED